MFRVLVLDGHPESNPQRFCHALAEAYRVGATIAGATVRIIRAADLDIAPLYSQDEFARSPDNPDIQRLQQDIEWADHIALVFPLWLGSAPAKMRAVLEQASRGGFFAESNAKGWRPHLRGKSARLIVTMGMPALVYRFMFGAHGVKCIQKSILGFAGVSPVKLTLLGGIGAGGIEAGARRLAHVRDLGTADSATRNAEAAREARMRAAA